MSRLVNIIFALVLLAALVIALDPRARARATEMVRDWEPTLKQLDDRVILNPPSIDDPDQPSTPVPTSTPFPTEVAADDEQIPVTGDEDSSNEPFIQVNWDAIGDALKEFWASLSEVEIDLTPNDNR